MAVKKIEMRPKGAGDYSDVLYPKTSTDMVVDEATGKTVASHLAEDASLTAKGHVRLSSATDSTDETMAATPKAVKSVKDAIPILNNTVTSTSTTQGATANAVKTAYDKAVANALPTGGGAGDVLTKNSGGAVQWANPNTLDAVYLYNEGTSYVGLSTHDSVTAPTVTFEPTYIKLLNTGSSGWYGSVYWKTTEGVNVKEVYVEYSVISINSAVNQDFYVGAISSSTSGALTGTPRTLYDLDAEGVTFNRRIAVATSPTGFGANGFGCGLADSDGAIELRIHKIYYKY